MASILKRLLGQTFIYALGDLLTRGFGLVLIPVYALYLSPRDFGIMSVGTAITNVLGIVIGLGLAASITRYYYEWENDSERRALFGTVWIVLLFASGAMSLLLERLGPRLSSALFPGVPFLPYVRLAIWTAFGAHLSIVPQALFRVRGQARYFAAFNVAQFTVLSGIALYLIIFRHAGAAGSMLAAFLASAITGLAYIAVAIRNIDFRIDLSKLKLALVLGLPLVPHLLMHWVLSLSDRLILSRYATLEEVGVYSLGYQLGQPIFIIAVAINNAWVPFFYENLSRREMRHRITRTATYLVAGTTLLALVAAVAVPGVITEVTPPSYHAAVLVVPWVLLAGLMQLLYYIWVNALFYSKNVNWIPLTTMLAATMNIAMNILLVPRYGMIAAALSTGIAYALLAGANGLLAHWKYRVCYEYARWVKVIAAAVACYLLAQLVTLPSWWAIAAKPILAAALWLLLLMGLNFWTTAERLAISVFLRQIARHPSPAS
jgi:O-antigen/teichoic acid export membrane protein